MTDANASTHGGPRPGAGRKHLDGTPPGNDAADPAERHTVTMPASYWAIVRDVGGGVYSEGLRTIIEVYMDEWIDIRTGDSKMKTLKQLGTPWAEVYRGSGRFTGRFEAEPVYTNTGEVAPGWVWAGEMTPEEVYDIAEQEIPRR